MKLLEVYLRLRVILFIGKTALTASDELSIACYLVIIQPHLSMLLISTDFSCEYVVMTGITNDFY